MAVLSSIAFTFNKSEGLHDNGFYGNVKSRVQADDSPDFISSPFWGAVAETPARNPRIFAKNFWRLMPLALLANRGAFHGVTRNYLAEGAKLPHADIRLAKCGWKKPPNRIMTDKTGRQELRGLISAPEIIAALEEHIFGRQPLTASQVSAALALLKKILPDPSTAAGEDTGEHEDRLEDLG